MNFAEWLDMFVSEKGIDTEQEFEVEGESGMNYIPLEVVIEHMKIAPAKEQAAIKTVFVQIDFANGDVVDYFRHLAKAIAI